MNKFIVSTTVNPPTEAIRRFDTMPGWQLLVVGDLDTPPTFRLENGQYWGPAAQESYDRRLSDAIGWHCIQRRNIGILLALDAGADTIALVDDDNVPLDHWGESLLLNEPSDCWVYEVSQPAFDPIGATNYPQLWHRGFPLPLLTYRNYGHVHRQLVQADVQADFWDGDPDVDAICRMEHRPECTFEPRYFPMAATAPSPFNSQNTFFNADVLKDYFLYPFIGRMDDIWAAYYVQAVGWRAVYGKASVFQARNRHDLVKDMTAEFLGYEKTLRLLTDLARDPESITSYLPARSVEAWALYRAHFRG